VAGHTARWLAWVVLLFGLWLLLAGQWNRVVVIAGAVVAVAAASAATLAWTRAGLEARIPLAWLASARTVPVMIVVDFAVVTRALVRALRRRERVGGAFRVKPFPAPGRGPAGAAVEAWVTVAATVSLIGGSWSGSVKIVACSTV
jgi:hypothetical protein